MPLIKSTKKEDQSKNISTLVKEGRPNAQNGQVLSSRWRDEVTIDRDYLSHRTRRGKVIVASSAFITGGAIIDQLRESKKRAAQEIF